MRRLLLSLCLVLPVGLAGAETFDYTTCWTHLTDQELHHFLYDCGGVVDLAVKGNFAYAADDWQGLQVVDCTDPLGLVYRGFVAISQPTACGVREHFVFVVNHAGTVVVVNVDDHDAPEILRQISTGADGRDLVVNGTWLYVLGGDDALRVYSIAAPAQPALVRIVTLPAGRSHRLALADDRLVAAGHGGLAVYDVGLPDWPALLGTRDFSGAVLGLDLRGALALVGHDEVSRLYDVGEPGAIVELATLDSGGKGALLTSGGEAWLGWGYCWFYGGLNVFDVSVPTMPVLSHQEIDRIRGWSEAMVEYQGLVYVGESMCWCAGEWPAMHVFQPGSWPLPEPLASVARPGASGLLRHGESVHLATREGLETWDLQDPANPRLLHTLDASSTYWQLVENAGFIATIRIPGPNDSRLHLIERDAAGMPTPRGEVPVTYVPQSLALSGALALLGYDGQRSMVVVDVVDPDTPFVTAELLPGVVVSGVALHGDVAAIATGNELQILDLGDVSSPVLLATVPNEPYYRLYNLAFTEGEGRLLLTAARSQSYNFSGAYADILDLTDPTDPRLLASLHQLSLCDPGNIAWHGDLLAVGGATHLSFYRWPSLEAPIVFAGRVPVSDGLNYGTGRRTVVCNGAVATAYQTGSGGLDGELQIWPLPAGVLTAAPEVVPRPSRLATVVAPNPFNPAGEIVFNLPATGPVTVAVFDVRGRLVRQLLNGTRTAGRHTVRWDGNDRTGRAAASGVYVVRVRTDGETAGIKVTLTR